MPYLNAHTHHTDLGGGRNRYQIGVAPLAYPYAGGYREIVSTWEDSGIAGRPHLVSRAQLMVSTGDKGERRIHPTRDPERYGEMGGPWVQVGGVWTRVPFSGGVRSGRTLTWERPEARLSVTHAGHYIDQWIELLGGYRPENGRIAFPVGLTGLTRSGANILQDGVPVMRLRPPVVTDLANPEDVRQVAWEFVPRDGQMWLLLTLPSLAGMARPCVDPTYTLPSPTGAGEDTKINAVVAGNNYGISTTLVTLGRASNLIYGRGLIRMDQSSIPAGDTIISGGLALVLTSANAIDNDFGAYRSLVQWYEGQKDGAGPDAGQDGSTWQYRNKNGDVTWAGGAGGASGSDWAAVATDVKTVNDDPATVTFDVTADVQAFHAGTYTNYGWWIRDTDDTTANGDRKTFGTSDNGTAANRPLLTIVTTAAGGDDYPVSLSVARTLSASPSGAGAGQGAVSLARTASLAAGAGAAARAALPLSREQAVAMVASALAAAGLSQATVRSVTASGSAVNAEVYTPAERVFAVAAQARVYDVPAEDRVHTVPEQNRVFEA